MWDEDTSTEESPDTIDQQATWTTSDGYTHATDANGNDYIVGFNPAYVYGNTNIPNDGSAGAGPGSGPGASDFSLGNVATGIANGVRQFQSALPAVFNAIQTGKNAITAINTPTATQQWITMPLQTKILLGAALAGVAFVLVKGKL